MKVNKLGVYVIIALTAFYIYTVSYMLICCAINVQPSDFMCVAFAVVTVAEIVTTAFIKSGNKVTRDDIGFVAEVVGKVLNIDAPSMSSGNTGYQKESEENNGDVEG